MAYNHRKSGRNNSSSQGNNWYIDNGRVFNEDETHIILQSVANAIGMRRSMGKEVDLDVIKDVQKSVMFAVSSTAGYISWQNGEARKNANDAPTKRTGKSAAEDDEDKWWGM